VARQRRDKLLSGICESPKNVKLSDACRAAEKLLFAGRGQAGSHHGFSRTGEPVGLNFQEVGGGKIPEYQAKQLIRMIDKYWNFEADRLKTQDEIDAEG
jgi:hypothetical protein